MFIAMSTLLQLLAVCSVCTGKTEVIVKDERFLKGTVFAATVVIMKYKNTIIICCLKNSDRPWDFVGLFTDLAGEQLVALGAMHNFKIYH